MQENLRWRVGVEGWWKYGREIEMVTLVWRGLVLGFRDSVYGCLVGLVR
jgi:hypothetical protein